MKISQWSNYEDSMRSLCIEALTGEQRVNAHAIFIAEPDVAEEMKTCMPAGHAHLVMDTTGPQQGFWPGAGWYMDDSWCQMVENACL